MKKITNVQQLRMEQERLEIKQLYIESALNNSWSRFKRNLNIKNIAKETVLSVISPKNSLSNKQWPGLVKYSLYAGAMLLFRKWMKD